MKITDLRCAVIGKHPIVRIVTDEGLHGLGEVEYTKPYLKPWVLHFRDALIGEDPTDVERVMLKIRQRGSFKPYGAAVSAIEHALWDIAGKAAGVPVYKLLGGKVRDKVRVYNGSIRQKRTGDRPEDYAADVKWMMEQPRELLHGQAGHQLPLQHEGHASPDFHYGVRRRRRPAITAPWTRAQISERGFNHMLDCVIAMKEVLGDKVSLALDCGPGWFLPDAIRFARAVEKYNLMWLEDMLTGDYVPWVNPQAYRELTHVDLDADPHRRADLPAPQLQGADRDAGGARHRPRPGRYRRHRRAQMGRRARLHALDPDGAARHRQRPARPRRADQCLRHAARQLHRLRISRRASDPWWDDIVIGLPEADRQGHRWSTCCQAPGLGLDIDAEGAQEISAGRGRRLLRLIPVAFRR